MQNYKGSIVIDTGIFIEFFKETDLGVEFKKIILGNKEIIEVLIHDLIISEIYYIFCRVFDQKQARAYIEDLLEICTVINSKHIRLEAAQIKCERAISLSDSYTCAIGRVYEIPVVFKTEKELEREVMKKAFDFTLFMV